MFVTWKIYLLNPGVPAEASGRQAKLWFYGKNFAKKASAIVISLRDFDCGKTFANSQPS
jgi:hypothetical protein